MNRTGQSIADTSLLAFQQLQSTGVLSHQQKAILHFLAERPQGNFTRAELADHLGMRLSSICGRVNELLDPLQNHGRAWLDELPRRRCSISGSLAHPVRIHQPPGQLGLFA